MFRWMASRPAVFLVGLTAGALAPHQLSTTFDSSEANSGVVAAAEPVAKKIAKTPQKYEPLPAADDKVDRLPIPRIGGLASDERIPANASNEAKASGSIANKVTQPKLEQQSVTTVSNPVLSASEIRSARIVKPVSPAMLRQLARSIQTELVRAGCRSVAVSGHWDSRSVRASAKFLSNRNALLPSDRPDVVLLSMLRGYKGRACGLDEQQNIIAQPASPSSSGQPITIRSASLSDATFADSSVDGAAPVAEQPNALPPVAVVPSRPKSRRPSNRKQASSIPRKKKLNWRKKFYYGHGADG